jgi:hypothetical protein
MDAQDIKRRLRAQEHILVCAQAADRIEELEKLAGEMAVVIIELMELLDCELPQGSPELFAAIRQHVDRTSLPGEH